MINKKEKRIKITVSATFIVVALLTIGLIVNHFADNETTLNTSELEQSLQSESDIVTQSNNMKVSATYKAVKKLGFTLPFTETKEKISCKGSVKAGYNMKHITISSDDDKKIIYVNMPKFKIISTTIDKESFEHDSIAWSIFNLKGIDYTVELMDTLEKELAKEAKANLEFKEKALKNAEKVIGEFIAKIDSAKGYRVICTQS